MAINNVLRKNDFIKNIEHLNLRNNSIIKTKHLSLDLFILWRYVSKLSENKIN